MRHVRREIAPHAQKVTALRARVTAPHARVTVLHARVTVLRVMATAPHVMATAPHAKALKPANPVNPVQKAKVAVNAVAVAVASAQTVRPVATCQPLKTQLPMPQAMALTRKPQHTMQRKMQVSNAQNAPRVKMDVKVADASAVVVAVVSAVSAHHATSNAQTRPTAAVRTWPTPVWQQVQ